MAHKSRASLRVAVLAGGDSPERAVSLASGQAVARALVAAGHEVICMDPALVEHAGDPTPNMLPFAQPTSEQAGAGLPFVPWQLDSLKQFDGCFLALHGGAGEDGTLQRLLAGHGIPFTGPDAASAQLAMSKRLSKERFRAAGLPTPDYRAF